MIHHTIACRCLVSLALFGACGLLSVSSTAANWPRYTIDKTSQGADGIRLTDVNGDGRLDIATGWEESGAVRIYVCPKSDFVRKPWPMTEGWYRGRSRGCRLCRCRWIFGRSQLLRG